MSSMQDTEAYRELRAEVAKVDSASAQVDWARVCSLADELRNVGRDLLVAVYCAHARHNLQGNPGLPACLDGVTELMREAWTEMTPPPTRTKARVGALEWLVQRTDIALASSAAKPDPPEAGAIEAAVKRLQAVARERLGTQTPTFSPLLSRIERWQAPEPPKNTETARHPLAGGATPKVATPESEPLQSRPASTSGSNPGEAPSLPDLGRQVRALATDMRRADPCNPAGYRLLRVGIWLHIQTPPPTLHGVTRVPPLPGARRALLEGLARQGRWDELLSECESLAVDHCLCLDLQRLAARALDALGVAYRPALQSVLAEVQNLVRRLPELESLLAADSSPLADEATRSWLATAVMGASGGAAPAAVAPTELGTATAARGAFYQRLQQAEAALEAGHARVALALYESLEKRLARHRLALWEPGLSVRCLRGHLLCLRQLPGPPRPQAARVYTKLARLDPRVAIEMG